MRMQRARNANAETAKLQAATRKQRESKVAADSNGVVRGVGVMMMRGDRGPNKHRDTNEP